MQAFKFNFLLLYCQLFNQRDFMDFLSSLSKTRKTVHIVRVILTKIHLFLLTASLDQTIFFIIAQKELNYTTSQSNITCNIIKLHKSSKLKCVQ